MTCNIICKICKKEFKQITGGHLQTHNITSKEYKNLYGPLVNPVLKDLWRENNGLGGGHRSGHKVKRICRIEEYNKNPNLCEQCSQPILYEKKRNKFCSKNCSAIYNNHRRAKPEEYMNNYVKYCDNKWILHICLEYLPVLSGYHLCCMVRCHVGVT